MNTQIASFLTSYRSTPHATTSVAPNELLLQRKVCTKFDMLQPDVQGVVQDKQSLQKKYHDNRAKLRTFTPGQTERLLIGKEMDSRSDRNQLWSNHVQG